jgi:putative ABC transport system permease protein
VEIVGIARSIAYEDNAGRTPTDFMYLPLAQRPVARMELLLRSSGDPLQLVKPLKDVIGTLDANMPMLETRTYEELYRYSTVEGPRVAIELVGTMGAIGLVMAIAGLYGLVAYNVSRRTREIGIRIAIGAGPSDVLRLVMGKGLVLMGTGTAIGLVMGLALERLMNAMLFNAGGVDILAYLVIVPSLLAATLLATYAPARRASRIAPTLALRYE